MSKDFCTDLKEIIYEIKWRLRVRISTFYIKAKHFLCSQMAQCGHVSMSAVLLQLIGIDQSFLICVLFKVCLVLNRQSCFVGKITNLRVYTCLDPQCSWRWKWLPRADFKACILCRPCTGVVTDLPNVHPRHMTSSLHAHVAAKNLQQHWWHHPHILEVVIFLLPSSITFYYE